MVIESADEWRVKGPALIKIFMTDRLLSFDTEGSPVFSTLILMSLTSPAVIINLARIRKKADLASGGDGDYEPENHKKKQVHIGELFEEVGQPRKVQMEVWLDLVLEAELN